MHDTNSLTATATTSAERSVRVGALVYDADSSARQAIAEAGAQRVRELAAEGVTFDPATLRLAEQIAETFEPEVPAFEVGETVALAEDAELEPECFGEDAERPKVLGKVTERYINEKGEWEYHIKHPRWQSWFKPPYPESDLAPITEGR